MLQSLLTVLPTKLLKLRENKATQRLFNCPCLSTLCLPFLLCSQTHTYTFLFFFFMRLDQRFNQTGGTKWPFHDSNWKRGRPLLLEHFDLRNGDSFSLLGRWLGEIVNHRYHHSIPGERGITSYHSRKDGTWFESAGFPNGTRGRKESPMNFTFSPYFFLCSSLYLSKTIISISSLLNSITNIL